MICDDLTICETVTVVIKKYRTSCNMIESQSGNPLNVMEKTVQYTCHNLNTGKRFKCWQGYKEKSASLRAQTM